MVELDMHKFGGRGSGSGGGGAGSTGTGRGGSPGGGKGSAGGTKKDSGGAPAASKKSVSVSEPVQTIDVNSRYIIYNSQGKELRSDVSGASLQREIEDKKLKYNNSYGKWVVKSNNKQLIIRRRK